MKQKNKTPRRSAWRSVVERVVTEPVGAIATGVSVFAFASSVVSCHISQRALDLSEQQYRQERSLILKATVEEGTGKIHVAPTDGSLSLLEARVFLPTRVFDREVPIRGDGNLQGMGSIEFGLEELVRERVKPKPTSGHVTVSENHLPIFISSRYAVRGDVYTDNSLYRMGYEAIVSGEAGVRPKVFVNGLYFQERLAEDEPLNSERVNATLEEGGYFIRPKSP